MRILIVVPRYVDKVGDFYQFPLGLGYVGSAMREAGHDVVCVNCNNVDAPPARQVGDAVRTHRPDVVATGGLSPFLAQLQTIFRAAKEAGPNVITLAGGGALSADPKPALKALGADVGVIGEGEITVVDLLEALAEGKDLGSVSGLVYRDRDGTIKRTAERPVVMDLGSIAWPDYDLLEYPQMLEAQRPLDAYFLRTQADNNPRCVDMVTSRSCPFRCTFCFHPAGKVYRERPLDDFFAELDSLVAAYDINMVGIIDELFSLRKPRLLEFCERIRPYGLNWMVQLHVNSADENILDAMHDAGCSYISYGIESMSEPVLVSMKKKAKKARIDETLARTRAKRIGIQGNLIFGDTVETVETANESLAWWADNRRYLVHMGRIDVYPGSPDYIEAFRDGLITDRDSFVARNEISINISRMNDSNLDVLTSLLYTYAGSVLNLVRASRFEAQASPDPLRGAVHDIDWSCPECGHDNTYRSCVLPKNESHSHRMTCRACRVRFDIIDPTFKADDRPEQLRALTDTLFDQFRTLARAGRLQEAQGPFRFLMRQLGDHWMKELPKAEIDLALGRDADCIHRYAFLIGRDPLNPRLLHLFGEALQKLGLMGGAALYFQQALLADPTYEPAKASLSALEALPLGELERKTFMRSFSDAPPPKRGTGSVAGQARKDHLPSFPDLDNLHLDNLHLEKLPAE